MNYYKSAYYSYQPTTTHSIYYQDYQTQQQQRGYGQRTSDPRRNQHPSLISGYSQSSFDSPSSYLSTPKDLFGYENQNSSTKISSGAGADAGSTANQGESISGMLSNFSKALGKSIATLYVLYQIYRQRYISMYKKENLQAYIKDCK